MSEAEIIHDAEVIGTELEPVQHGTLFRTDDPAEMLRRASVMAEQLAAVVRKQNLTSNISGKEHVRVEGWTLLGSMLGVFPVCVWTKPIGQEGRSDSRSLGWEARVEARTLSGQVVGAAEAQCDRTENQWKSRDDYALRSMAQTRATSKALRQPLGFVMQLAGFDPTPAEEMPRDGASVPVDKQAEQRVEGPKPLAAPTTWPKLTEMMAAYDEATLETFGLFVKSAAKLLYPQAVDMNKLPSGDKKFLLQKAAGAALHIREAFEPSQMPYPGVEDIRVAFARVLDGQELAIPEEKLDAEAVEAAEREA